MVALMPEGLGGPVPTEAEDKPRVRVRLHFGGSFAKDGPLQWRYVGGEVYNESFPMDSKYAEVSKRLNDKFGDTVSFKYLCPGDDIDPDNLVQVQGDDDLREMCDEYQNALQKPSTPVKTMRIKVFVFRAVIFEREVQELEEGLDEEDELQDLPEEDEPLSSCDHEECGPNWSDWGEPDEQEVTESSMPSAHLSSDAELHTGAAVAVATAAATAALQNMSVGAHSFSSSRTVATLPALSTSTAAISSAGQGVGAVTKSRLSPAGLPPGPGGQQVDAMGGGSGGPASRLTAAADRAALVTTGKIRTGGESTGAAAAAAVITAGHWPASSGSSRRISEVVGSGAAAVVGTEDAEAYASEAGADATTVPADEEAEAEYYEYCFAEMEGQVDEEQQQQQHGYGVEVAEDGVVNGGAVLGGCGGGQYLRRPVPPRPLPGGNWLHAGIEGAQTQWRGPVQEEWENCERVWELEQQQERQQIQRQQQERQQNLVGQQEQEWERNCLIHDQRDLMESGVGFYCDEELEDPYGDPYEDAAADDSGLYAVHNRDGPCQLRNTRSSAASDGAVRMMPRAADVAAYGDHLQEQYGNYAAGATGSGGRGPGAGLLDRLPAAADLLPRHISAFGESSRDDSQGGGGGGGVHGTGPFLPSRITIFGDDGGVDSLQGSPHGGEEGSSTGGDVGPRGGVLGGLHRLALLSAGASPWPNPSATNTNLARGMVAAAGFLDHAEAIVAGESRQWITQEFGTQQQSSLLEGTGLHGSSGEEKAGGGAGGGGGGGRMPPLDPLLCTGLGAVGAGGGGLLGVDGVDALSPASIHNHPLKGVVKKRKSEVSILAKIGEGAFGEVSQAQVFPYGIVAIKWLKRERFAKYSESFQREAETLAKLNHPNIIRMYGLVMDTPDTATFGGSGGPNGGGAAGAHGGGSGGGGSGGGVGASGSGTPTGLIGGIITEFVRNGSLGQYLRSLTGRRLSLRQRAMIAMQACLGMAYLHEQSPAVVHFDLKPDNLLVDGEGDTMVIKVADFGLSKHKLSNYVSCRDLRGTLPYMAYELVSSSGNISEKVDVYSMGVVMWEMYTGEVPFAHLTAQEILTGLLHGNLHLAIPPACEPEWRSLVETCMDPNPANRPSFQELTMQLQEILRLERQASNASSVSAATAAAAAAAVLDSTATAPDSGGGAAAAAGGAAAGVQLLNPQAGGLDVGQWRAPGHPGVGVAGQGPVRSPAAPSPMPSPQVPVQPPQPPLYRPLLAVPPLTAQAPAAAQLPQPQQQAQQHLLAQTPQPQPVHPPLPGFLRQQPPTYGNVVYGMMTPPQQQPQHMASPAPPQPAPQHPLPHQQPQQQQLVIPQRAPQQLPSPGQLAGLHYHHQPQHHQHQPRQQQQQSKPPSPFIPAMSPLLGMPPAMPGGNLPTPHLMLPLRPPTLFPPPPPQLPPPHVQHLNALYGLAGGAATAGLPPLVTWGDRGM